MTPRVAVSVFAGTLYASYRRSATASAPMDSVKVTADALGFEMWTCRMRALVAAGAVYLVAAAFETWAGPWSRLMIDAMDTEPPFVRLLYYVCVQVDNSVSRTSKSEMSAARRVSSAVRSVETASCRLVSRARAAATRPRK